MDGLRRLNDIPGFTGPDGAHIRELAGRSTALLSHSLALIIHPAGTGSGEHHHAVADEVYFVQSGAGRITIDGETSAIGPGDIVTIWAGQRHKVSAPAAGEGPDMVLIVSCAPAYEVGEVVWDK